jgi:flagellar biosynthetic protein FliP
MYPTDRKRIGAPKPVAVILALAVAMVVSAAGSFAQTGGSSQTQSSQASPQTVGSASNAPSTQSSGSTTNNATDPKLTLSLTPPDSKGRTSFAVEILAIMTVLSLAPAILVMLTSFTRIVVVMSFLRHALGTQQMPPSQLLIGLSLFLTLVVMMPVLTTINTDALQPYLADEISQKTAFQLAKEPLKTFMLKQTREKDIALFVKILQREKPATPADLGMEIVVPSFIISELKTAFVMGFVIYIPFVIIDMVVSSVLMSMGMLMLPPVMISLPFKILLFVLVDGWNLVVQSLLKSF